MVTVQCGKAGCTHEAIYGVYCKTKDTGMFPVHLRGKVVATPICAEHLCDVCNEGMKQGASVSILFLDTLVPALAKQAAFNH